MSAGLPSIVATAGAMSLALLGDQMLYVVLPAHPEAAGIGVAALGLVPAYALCAVITTSAVAALARNPDPNRAT